MVRFLELDALILYAVSYPTPSRASPMMQMPRESRSHKTVRAAAVLAGIVLSCGAVAAQAPGSLPESATQPGSPQQYQGPRALPPSIFPPGLRGLPPRPGSPESRLPPTAPTQMAQPANPSPSPSPMTPGLNTSAPGNNAMPAPIASTPLTSAPPRTRPRAAQVQFANGMLDVRADDSSLRQILRSIARRTGMKITGGVADQRVYGNYGPAPASSILATLLDGTGVNMFLRSTPDAVPVELLLTPRTGEVTPPTLDTTVDDDANEAVSPPRTERPVQSVAGGVAGQIRQTSGPVSLPQPMNDVNGSPNNTSPTASTFPTTNSVPIDTIPSPSTTPSSSGIVDAPNPPPPGSTTSPTASTPEGIYQQLLKLQQKQQQNQGGSTPP